MSTTDAAGVKRRDVGSTVETVEESEPSLEEKISELKIKVANLVKDGKQVRTFP